MDAGGVAVNVTTAGRSALTEPARSLTALARAVEKTAVAEAAASALMTTIVTANLRVRSENVSTVMYRIVMTITPAQRTLVFR